MEELSEKEREIVKEFKELLVSNGLAEKIRKEDFNDRYCIRWLKARKFEVDKALEMLTQHLKWREENQIEKYNMAGAKDCLDIDIIKYMGEDKMGRPTLVVTPGLTVPGALPLDQVEVLTVLTLEVIMKCMKNGNEHLIVIFDYEGWGLRNVDKALDNKLLALGQSNYPERLKEALLIDAPWYFSTVWAVLKLFLDEKTRSKVNFIGKNARDELLQRYDPESLVEKFGGSVKPKSIRDYLSEKFKDENETLGEFLDRMNSTTTD